MNAFRNPVVLFLATGLLSLGVIVVGTTELARRAASEESVADALATTEVLAKAVAEPSLPRGLIDLDPGAIDRFDRAILDRLQLTDVRRIKIWDSEGRILYSDQTDLIGEVFPLDEIEQRILTEAGSDAQVSDLSRPENRFERGEGGLVEVYTLIRSPEGEPLLFEVYYSAAAIDSRSRDIASAFRPITLGSLGLVVLVATGLLWVQTRSLRRGAAQREELLRAAVDSSDAERVRIARDLHDGVVQDLAGASYSVAAVARTAGLDATAARALDEAATSMRDSLRSLRSLMVEIYPPDLHSRGLRTALDDLIAPASAAGVEATVEVGEVEDASPAAVALVWRVTQEAVRNALRHSRARTLRVEVGTVGSLVLLSVTDDGVGFDPQAQPTGHFGLRGLRGLARESGGLLEVDSAPGRGTTVRLEVPANTQGPQAIRRRRR